MRIGAIGFSTFTDNPFFQAIDFDALLNKEIDPVFIPSSEKTNFDATYDLEELLLEEAPLEARARRQKPREQLKDDATDQEIRADELHRMIETMFEPFNYTTVAADRPAAPTGVASAGSNVLADQGGVPADDSAVHPKQPPINVSPDVARVAGATPNFSRSTSHTPNGSPPLPTGSLANQSPTSARGERSDYFPPSDPNAPDNRREGRPRGSTRNTSQGGGVQVVLNGTGSWSDMANQSSSMLQKDDQAGAAGKPSGMLGFLSRKKGRDRSPKARERGVLGKDGARVIISSS